MTNINTDADPPPSTEDDIKYYASMAISSIIFVLFWRESYAKSMEAIDLLRADFDQLDEDKKLPDLKSSSSAEPKPPVYDPVQLEMVSINIILKTLIMTLILKLVFGYCVKFFLVKLRLYPLENVAVGKDQDIIQVPIPLNEVPDTMDDSKAPETKRVPLSGSWKDAANKLRSFATDVLNSPERDDDTFGKLNFNYLLFILDELSVIGIVTIIIAIATSMYTRVFIDKNRLRIYNYTRSQVHAIYTVQLLLFPVLFGFLKFMINLRDHR